VSRGRQRVVGRRAGRALDRARRFDATEDAAGVRLVLATPSRAGVAGAAVAAEGDGLGGGVPVIALWDGGAARSARERSTGDVGDGDSGPSDQRPVPWATPRARRAVAPTEQAGVEATATGSTVRVALPADEAQAIAALERLTALSGRGPLICVLARAWGGAWLRVIERAGTVHVAGTAASTAASRVTLRRHHVAVSAAPRPTGPVAAALLRAGWTARGLVRSAIVRDHASDAPVEDRRARVGDDHGQATLMLLLGLTLAIGLAAVLGAVATAMGGREDRQRAVDVAALSAAAQLRAGTTSVVGGHRRSDAALRSRAVAVARTAARENGVPAIDVDFPGDGADASGGSPQRVRVRAIHRPTVAGVTLASAVAATAEVAAPTYVEAAATGDEYAGPLAVRQGKPMRPDVALAFDRMNAAATAAGHPLTVTSGYRSNAEQARLFAAHPDPKWVARPGTSLHRLGTELDLGPASAYGWLAANSRAFGFVKRYSWEPWHFGYVRETASAHVAEQGRNPAAPLANGTIPPWVPAAYRDLIRAASIRSKISAAMLSAQLKAESDFDPRVVSSAGAQGIAQFMPGTAATVGLRDAFDPAQAIPAQARLMARLLRRFGSVPLALAAYNAGEGRVGACRCVPPYPETQRYVARIIALMRGYDDGADGSGLTIRLVA
jgi:soluble lytic murein transglycosylase-like protein